MSGVKRVYVEKKPDYAVAAKALRHEIRRYLGIMDVTGVRVLIRYDVENISDETFEKACSGVFAEPPVDILYKESFLRMRTAAVSPWNIFPDSSTRERILRSSASVSSMRTKRRWCGWQLLM